MLEQLSQNLEGIFKKLRGQGKLSEDNISDAMREVRRALLEADVNYKVVRTFINSVKEKALGSEVLRSITPGQQIVKIIHEELIVLLGEKTVDLELSGNPAIILLVGLQGSGKTTTSAKLARNLRKSGRQPLLVACDVYRPAAITQLQVLGKQLDIPVFADEGNQDVVQIAQAAIRESVRYPANVVIVDTAGRLHVDADMMDEVKRLQQALKPAETLFVADAMTGQDAVNAAGTFAETVDLTGVILTKLDGDARGGAALSVREVTGKPIKYIGVGEHLDKLETFHPDRMAGRILGMGDIVSLVEKAQQDIDVEEAAKLEEKMLKNTFDLEDFKQQLKQLKSMGPIGDLMSMIPGAKGIKDVDIDEKRLTRIEAIINSMTLVERHRPQILDGSRRKRIARGSGTKVQDVNQLIKQFQSMRKMMKKFGKMNKRQLMKNLPMGF
ncbi:MAG: signal recognition particle protein [Candidatus Marinimicrobia bacterium]|jgi:signal recognition particle subunit SRP54|nr:signal recognition particle protein [Candidatus Neomarinimicrobiota bacterium]MBT3575365.1 signal recognition particle protein [Candidatus Neomarinimicrobiota bacterium]MBT3680720.1 signal recognition particle protein [Candidatus Neomarinimicrobiota bacterium]MBT3950136.1 signal recognition particle protein [Candidatus Neomarinimicrobiota bacterium]MBT4253796.1 signal recognition particle protein [Candidatus Neomarinimicrobiota bacterium]